MNTRLLWNNTCGHGCHCLPSNIYESENYPQVFRLSIRKRDNSTIFSRDSFLRIWNTTIDISHVCVGLRLSVSYFKRFCCTIKVNDIFIVIIDYYTYYIYWVKTNISCRGRPVSNLHLLMRTRMRTDSNVQPMGTGRINDAPGQMHHLHVD